jgi:dienelactone hydrolase
VFARAVYAIAAVAFALAVAGLIGASREVSHYRVDLRSGAPAVVWEPGPPAPFGPAPREGPGLPVVVLAHGFASSQEMMSSLARRLARAGYAVIAFDFRGHGRNPQPLTRALLGSGDGLLEDVEAAVLLAKTDPRFDGTRVAVAGHSMGAGAVLSYAAREPSVAATIAISGAFGREGPYAPPNPLLIWAAGDPSSLREGARARAARLAGLEQVVLDRSYGDPERGNAVRASEVDGTDHLTILWSATAAERILDWLTLTLGPGEPPAPGAALADGRFGYALLGILAWVVLAFGLVTVLAPLVPVVEAPRAAGALRRIGYVLVALVGGVVLVALADPRADAAALAFVPVLVGRDIAAVFTAAGAILCVGLAHGGGLRLRGLASAPTWLAALALVGFAFVGFGGFVSVFVGVALPVHRAPSALAMSLLVLPFFAATEALLRGPGPSGVWLPIAGKALTLVVIAGSAFAGLLSFVIVLGLGAFLVNFALFELLAWRMSRAVSNPWLPALVQSLWTGWTLAATFPVVGG